MRVEAVSETTHAPALEYLGRSPFSNVFLAHVLLHDAPASRSSVLVARDGARIAGVLYCSRQIVIAADDDAIGPLAEAASYRAGTRMIVGPREQVSKFWETVRTRYARPRLVRDRQLVMAIEPSRLRAHDGRVEVRHATLRELKEVTESSASMVRHELEYDPRRGSPGFQSGVRLMIEYKLWWVGVWNGRLCFFCNVGPWSEQTAQLQGIWTPPALRGRGLATAALGDICERLLRVSPTLSLYVNDFNEPAIALYRRVGFTHVGDFMTILF